MSRVVFESINEGLVNIKLVMRSGGVKLSNINIHAAYDDRSNVSSKKGVGRNVP